MYSASKINKQKLFVVGQWRKEQNPELDPDPLVRDTEPRILIQVHTKMTRIRIHTKMSRIRNTGSSFLMTYFSK
jgi:hypothetical protein